MSVCLSCARNLHDECENYNWAANVCCCNGAGVGVSNAEPVTSTGNRDGMAWSKHDGNIIDAKSTGRKRAAKLYPLQPNTPCEWQGLRYAGGGMFPIYGCEKGFHKHRHHGPDLSTLNNQDGNVHRICNDCHNIWHTNNDAYIKDFDGTTLWRPHDPNTKYDKEELVTIISLGRAKASRERFLTWEAYSKDKHDYRDYLRAKEGSA